MKRLLYTICTLLCLACTTVKYVPQETIKTEYVNIYSIDTIYRDRETYIKEAGDTVYITEKEYLYKYKCEIDTFLKVDTVTVVVTKIEEKVVEVNKLRDWQKFLMCVGGGFILLLIYKLYNKLK